MGCGTSSANANTNKPGKYKMETDTRAIITADAGIYEKAADENRQVSLLFSLTRPLSYFILYILLFRMMSLRI